MVIPLEKYNSLVYKFIKVKTSVQNSFKDYLLMEKSFYKLLDNIDVPTIY